jgi:hypothetical protein
MRAWEFIPHQNITTRGSAPKADVLRVSSDADRPSPPDVPDTEPSRVVGGVAARLTMKAYAARVRS